MTEVYPPSRRFSLNPHLGTQESHSGPSKMPLYPHPRKPIPENQKTPLHCVWFLESRLRVSTIDV